MTKRDRENWSRFHQGLIDENPDLPYFQYSNDVDELHRLNSRLHTLSERSCNGEGWSGRAYTWNEADEARFVRSWDNAMGKVKAIFAQYGAFEVEEQGDPRGWGMFEATSKKTGKTFRVNW